MTRPFLAVAVLARSACSGERVTGTLRHPSGGRQRRSQRAVLHADRVCSTRFAPFGAVGAVAAATAALAGAAEAADPPAGFRESPRLAVRAERIAGVPGVKVYCALTVRTFVVAADERGVPAGAAAFTARDEAASYYSPRYCSILEGWLRGRKVGLVQLGVASLVFVHEAVHLRGIDDEGQAECRALRELPRWLRTVFGVKRASTLRTVMRWARAAHARMPPAFRTVC